MFWLQSFRVLLSCFDATLKVSLLINQLFQTNSLDFHKCFSKSSFVLHVSLYLLFRLCEFILVHTIVEIIDHVFHCGEHLFTFRCLFSLHQGDVTNYAKYIIKPSELRQKHLFIFHQHLNFTTNKWASKDNRVFFLFHIKSSSFIRWRHLLSSVRCLYPYISFYYYRAAQPICTL